MLDLGLSEVVLASLVLRVGLQQARSMSKSAERGAVPHVQVRKDISVKSVLQRNEDRKHCEETAGLRETFGK